MIYFVILTILLYGIYVSNALVKLISKPKSTLAVFLQYSVVITTVFLSAFFQWNQEYGELFDLSQNSYFKTIVAVALLSLTMAVLITYIAIKYLVINHKNTLSTLPRYGIFDVSFKYIILIFTVTTLTSIVPFYLVDKHIGMESINTTDSISVYDYINEIRQEDAKINAHLAQISNNSKIDMASLIFIAEALSLHDDYYYGGDKDLVGFKNKDIACFNKMLTKKNIADISAALPIKSKKPLWQKNNKTLLDTIDGSMWNIPEESNNVFDTTWNQPCDFSLAFAVNHAIYDLRRSAELANSFREDFKKYLQENQPDSIIAKQKQYHVWDDEYFHDVLARIMLWNMLLLAALFAFIAFLNRKDESYS
jgi:hypothetical protein